MTGHPVQAQPGVAPWVRILHHARMELAMVLRNGEQLLLALVIPLGLLVGGMLFGQRFGVDRTTFPASILALAIWSTAFTSLAVATGFERRYGVLERLVATPLTRRDLLAGKMLSVAAIATGQLALLCGTALALGWRPVPSLAGTGVALISLPLAVATFAALALAMSGTLKAEVTLGLANLVYLLGLTLGGLVLEAGVFPEGAGQVIRLLPTAALGDALRAWANGSADVMTLPVLSLWAAGSALLAGRVFRWMA